MKCFLTTRFLKIFLSFSLISITMVYYTANIIKRSIGEIEINTDHSISKYQTKIDGKAVLNSINKTKDNNIEAHLVTYKQYEPLDWLSLFDGMDQSYEFSTKKILLYDTFESWGFDGEIKDCPVPHLESLCVFTQNIKEIVTADAVLAIRDAFHEEDVKVLQENNEIKIIYFTLESPKVTEIRMTDRTFLASYWRGSDFWVPYFNWESNGYSYNSLHTQATAINYAIGKTKLTVTVVSNCVPANQRNFYTSELKKYIQVDTYGRCGDLVCNDGTNRDECFEEISKEYKFYLAFENANCRDYITEKLFRNALKYNMIPVVLGAHRKDYEALAPKGSYIHVEDFQSPRDLANYLQLLYDNDTLYNEYFRWKETGRLVETHFFCSVCAMLQYSNFFPVKSRLDKEFIWNSNNEEVCLKSSLWYWDRMP